MSLLEEQAILGAKSLINFQQNLERDRVIMSFLREEILHIALREKMLYTANSPLDQFEIRDLIGLNAPVLGYLRIFVTNIGLYLTTATVIALAFSYLGTNKDKIVANH